MGMGVPREIAKAGKMPRDVERGNTRRVNFVTFNNSI